MQSRHRQIDATEGRATASLVAVEAKNRLVGHFPEQAKLIFRERGAERGHQRPPDSPH